MNFLLPSLIALAPVAAIALLAFYMWRPRARRRIVGALFLWGTTPDKADKTRMRFAAVLLPPMFFLELVALLLLVVCAAGPVLRRKTLPPPVVIVDDTPSMTARLSSGKTPRQLAERFSASLLKSGKASFVLYSKTGLPKSETQIQTLLKSSVTNSVDARNSSFIFLSDKSFSQSSFLPIGSRYVSFGQSMPNASIEWARRALSIDGEDCILIKFARYPDSEEPFEFTIGTANGESGFETQSYKSSTSLFRLTLPPLAPDLVVKLVPDALEWDNAATIPAPQPISCAFWLDMPEGVLKTAVLRALHAVGANAAKKPEQADLILCIGTEALTNYTATAQAKLLLAMHPSQVNWRVSMLPTFATPGEVLLEGVPTEGIAWCLPPQESTLPGVPVLYSGDTPVITRQSELNTYHISVPSSSDALYRSATWPTLIYNAVFATRKSDVEFSVVYHPAEESDLTDCGEADVQAKFIKSENYLDYFRPIDFAFAIAALCLMSIRLVILGYKHK